MERVVTNGRESMTRPVDESRAVQEVVQQYMRAWRLLFEYDEDRLAEHPAQPLAPIANLSFEAAWEVIAVLRTTLAARGETTHFFGQMRTRHLGAILAAIEQTFDGKPLYPTVQVRAAHLLYFVIKDHPFTDGNKRIGALLFLEYLRRNGLLMHADGKLYLTDNVIVPLALLVAQSEPVHKDLMIRLILNLLEGGSV